MATLPDGTPIPPIPKFPPPPPPPSSIGRKRQRHSNTIVVAAAKKPSTTKSYVNVDDEDANYVVYPSDDEDGKGLPTEDEEDDGETPRRRRRGGSTDDEFRVQTTASESEVTDDDQPRRKKAKGVGNVGRDEDDVDVEEEEEDVDMTTNGDGDTTITKINKSNRRISQKWREDVYKPPKSDTEDSEIDLKEFSPANYRRGKRKSGSLNQNLKKGFVNVTGGLVRNKSKSTPNLNPEKSTGGGKIRKSRFIEGSMGDRYSRPGGVPPFQNNSPVEEDEYDIGVGDNNGTSSGPVLSLVSKHQQNNVAQSTPPPPKSKFTFLAPISSWFSKKWQKATADFEDKQRKEKEKDDAILLAQKLLQQRKERAEQMYRENRITKSGFTAPLPPTGIREETLEDLVSSFVDGEIGVAVTTNEVYIAKDSKVNASSASLATIRPVNNKFPLSPRSSTDTNGSGRHVGDPAKISNHRSIGGVFADYRDNTPLTQDTVNSDIEGSRFKSRSKSPIPAPTPSKPLTKAEQKKKEKLEKKLEDNRRKLAETELELSQLIEVKPLKTTNTLSKKPPAPTSTPATDINIIEPASEVEDEADKIVESIMGEPNLIATVRSRSRSRSASPFKKIFGGGKSKDSTGAGTTLKKSKPAVESTLHNVTDSGRIKKGVSSSVRGKGRGKGRGGRGVSEDA